MRTPDVIGPSPWLLVAVPHEHRAFRRTTLATLRLHPTPAWRCTLGGGDFVFAETGIGGASTTRTLDWLLSHGRPSFVFLAGFAGALADDLCVGDSVHAEAVIDPPGLRRPASWATGMGRRGTLLTSDRLISTPEEKRRLAQTHNAAAVDMETSYLAEWCDRQAVPWGCVRVVSDDVQTSLSQDILSLLENGRISPLRLASAILRRPTIVRELLHLRTSTRIAAETIAMALTHAAKGMRNGEPRTENGE